MFVKANILDPTLSLRGDEVGFEDKMFGALSVRHRGNQIQEKISGNRCGHDPKAPRYYLRPDNHKPRPSLLEDAINQLKEAYRLPKKFLKNLNSLHPKNRRKRSERREAITSVSQVLIHYMDVITLQVGFNTTSGAFISLDLPYIAAKAGIAVIRAKRAIQDLVKAGYLTLSSQFARKDNGAFLGLASLRQLSLSFFSDLGIDLQRLDSLRAWKRKKEEKAHAKRSRLQLRTLIQAAYAFGRQAQPARSPTATRPSTAPRLSQLILPRPKGPSIDQALVCDALARHRADPSRLPSDYLKEALARQGLAP